MRCEHRATEVPAHSQPRLTLFTNHRVRRGLIITAVLAVVWLVISLAVAYALTRRHGPRIAEATPEIGDWRLESHRLRTSDGEELGAWFVNGTDNGPSVLILHGHAGKCMEQPAPWQTALVARLLGTHDLTSSAWRLDRRF